MCGTGSGALDRHQFVGVGFIAEWVVGAEHLAQRFGVWEIIAARFVYGTRIASVLFWGIQKLPFVRFAALDLIGCALWAIVFSSLGYFLSGSAAVLIGEVRRIEIWLLVAVAAIAFFFLLSRYLLRRKSVGIMRR